MYNKRYNVTLYNQSFQQDGMISVAGSSLVSPTAAKSVRAGTVLSGSATVVPSMNLIVYGAQAAMGPASINIVAIGREPLEVAVTAFATMEASIGRLLNSRTLLNGESSLSIDSFVLGWYETPKPSVEWSEKQFGGGTWTEVVYPSLEWKKVR